MQARSPAAPDGHRATSLHVGPDGVRPRLGGVIASDVLERILAGAVSAGADFAEVYAEDKRSTSASLDDGRVEQVTSGRDRGAGIRVVAGETTGFAYTSDLSEPGLAAAAAAAAAKATLDLARRQWQDGYAAYLTLLSAEQSYQQARINLAQAQASRYADTAALFQALGGGWWHQENLAADQRGK